MWTLHAEPFHVSARVTAADPVPRWPTARQLDAVGQDTAANDGASTPVGIFSSAQLLPFHSSAPTAPTAWHSFGRGHATADRFLLVSRSGVASSVQPRPFHCSAKGVAAAGP